VAEDKLQLLGPYMAWHPTAYTGRWRGPDGEIRDALCLLGREELGRDQVRGFRAAALTALDLRGRGILPLVDVCAHEDRVAWVYQHVEGVGLGQTVGDEGAAMLSTRAAAEAVASTAEILLLRGAKAYSHPGPTPDDLLVDRHGRLWIAGFSGPLPPEPAMQAPMSAGGEPAVVYRLGVLLATLVSGVAPAAATVETAHAALVRRALIRAMARPGPVLTERYGDWLRGMLAWDPGVRPPLSVVPDGLRKVAEATGGSSLVDWADAYVDELIGDHGLRQARPHRQVVDDHLRGRVVDAVREERARSSPSRPTPRTADEEARPTEISERHPPIEAYPEDDPTQEASGVSAQPLRRPPAIPSEPTSMPVSIGPPPEAIKPSPRLPSGFLDGEDDFQDEESLHPPPPDRLYWLWPVLMGLVILCLSAVAVALLLFLVWPSQPTAEVEPEAAGPSLADVIPRHRPSTEPEPTPTATPAPSPEITPEPPPEPSPEPTTVQPPSQQPPEPSPEVEVPPRERVIVVHSPEPTPPDEVLVTVPATAEAFEVTFRVAYPVRFEVTCNDNAGRGSAKLVLDGLRRGPCVVAAELEGRMIRANVPVTGPAEYMCFEDFTASCREVR